MFPVRISDGRRDVLLRELVSLRVFCPVHWRLPAQISEQEYPEAHGLSRQILGLPIDQRYGHDDMQSLIERLIQAWERLN